jgi:eukaryotic-like serine/threonine-protein kinase
MTLNTGTIIVNRYRIVKLLGQGGFGAVYNAWDLNLNRACALKENLDTSPEAESQFVREAQVLANLAHPNLPHISDHFLVPGQGQYLVMELVEGEDLESLVQRQGPLAPPQALHWIGQIADALEYMHSQQPPVIHRDIKPANIRITPEGRAVLVDFGLAKIYDSQLKTAAGARAVTEGYSPPEQYGQGATDARTDIYALAATLYTLLTGQQPQESVQRIVNEQVVPVDRTNAQIRPEVGQAIARSMSLNPSQRYQAMHEFKLALTSSVHGSPVAPVPVLQKTVRMPGAPALPPLQPAHKKRPALRVALAAILMMIIVAAGAIGFAAGWIPLPLAQVMAMVTPDASPTAPITTTAMVTPTVSITPTVTPLPPQLISRVVEVDSYRLFLPVLARNDKPRTAAQVRAATAQAKANATQAPHMTATAQFRDNWRSTIGSRLDRVYGPETDQLAPPATADAITLHAAGIDKYDVVIKATFTNPYAAATGAWSYGFFFRQTGPDDAYQLIVRSDGGWRLIDRTDTQTRLMAWGSVPNLRVAATDANTVEVLAEGGYGQLWVNDVFVAELNLTARTKPGDVSIATGFYAGDAQPDVSLAVTRYGNFAVWTLR